jgi:hypothetical protein
MFLLLPAMPMRSTSGRSRPMRAGCVLDVRTLFYLLKRSFGFKPLYHNTWHSNYNNYFIT